MKKILASLVLSMAVISTANASADMICFGQMNGQSKTYHMSLDAPNRALYVDGSKYYLEKSGHKDGDTYNFFKNESGTKTYMTVSGPSGIGFVEFTGGLKTQYGLCSSK